MQNESETFGISREQRVDGGQAEGAGDDREEISDRAERGMETGDLESKAQPDSVSAV